ncbi:Sulfite reductase [NADPH] hemoprotein beta-component [Candidatus Hodgkinia cicadicola]|nr:Sulfite reductase [NADPH] hemoprotein beta-component [Candidatus Hodgkinia cicadicola]
MNINKSFSAGVALRLLGKSGEQEFRSMRLFNGVYLQLHSYMLRVAVPNCQLSSKQLLALAHIALKYDRGYFHITTRQTIQFNWINLSHAVKSITALSKAGLDSSHTSGNCVRQITCDPLWGVCLDETASIVGLINTLRERIVLNPLIESLPKKVKVCVWAAYSDRVLSRFNDISIKLTEDNALVTLGGGLGRAPAAGARLIKLKTNLIPNWLLAFLRVYCALASTHKYSLRTKSLMRSLGKSALFKLTRCELESTDNVQSISIARYQSILIKRVSLINWLNSHKFETWYSNYTSAHRTHSARLIFIGSGRLCTPPGDITFSFANTLAKLIQRYGIDQVRITLTQTLVLPWAHVAFATNIYATCSQIFPRNVVCCPGLDYCTLANSRSILISSKLELFKTKLSIRVSGCVNACSQHHVFDVGIVGVVKANTEAYQVFVGGGARAGRTAKPISRAIPARKVLAVVQRHSELVHLLSKDAFECAHACVNRTRLSFRW